MRQRAITQPGARYATVAVAVFVWAGGGAGPAGAAGIPPAVGHPVVHGPSVGVRLIDVPARAAADPRARLYIVDHVNPGTLVRRRIEISGGGAAAHILVYPDAATIAKGSFLGARGHTANDLTSWTSVAPHTVDLRADHTTDVTVTIAVPSDAAPGERYGVIWAETRSAPVAAAKGNVSQVNRVGVRVYLSVGPGAPPAAQFTIESLTAERSPGGQPVVVAAVHNTGGRALDISGAVRLSHGPAGLSAGPFPATLGTSLAPGETEPVRTILDKRLPRGPWAADITLRSGLLEHKARATINFPDSGASPAVPVVPQRATSWKSPAIAAALLALTIASITFARRRGRPRVVHRRSA
ncbi:MAG: hypothetical protein QOJ71_602 [Actinomycetota bacterium]|nr:hypothetical protein [Actinomycetota bacterium]